MIFSFVEKPCELDELKNSNVYKLHNLLEENGSHKKLKNDDKKIIESVFNELWHNDTFKYGKYKLMGWIFDFSPWLNRYLVKDKFYGWREILAFNKTYIRKNAVTPSHILEIIELKN